MTQAEICKQTEAAFKETYSGLQEGALNKVVETWAGDLSIISHNIKAGDKLIIIAEDIEQDNHAYRYFVMRLFPGGKDGWHCSVDVDRKSLKEVMEHLLKNHK